MYDDSNDEGFDLTFVDFNDPITVEEALCVARIQDEAWLAFLQ
jgi:hypothetical protein